MQNKKIRKFLIIGTIIIFIILYTLIISDFSYNNGYDTGYVDGEITMYLAIDSIYILIPKFEFKQPPQSYKKFENDLFVQTIINNNYFLIKNNAYTP